MLTTPLCKQLGIAYPIFSVGMGPRWSGACRRGLERRGLRGAGTVQGSRLFHPSRDPTDTHTDGQTLRSQHHFGAALG